MRSIRPQERGAGWSYESEGIKPMFKTMYTAVCFERFLGPKEADHWIDILLYCLELDTLHNDLEQIVGRVRRTPRVERARTLSHIEWALRYHVYNFHIRVSAYREKLYKLLQIVFIHDHAGTSKKTQGVPHRKVLEAVEKEGFSRLAGAVRSFEQDEIVAKSLNHRHAYVHSLSLDWKKWKSLAPGRNFLREALESARAEESDEGHKDRRTVDNLQDMIDLDGFRKENLDALREILARLTHLRDDICSELAPIRSGMK